MGEPDWTRVNSGPQTHTHTHTHSSLPPARLCLDPPLAALNIWRRGTRPRIPHCARADLRFISLVSCPEQTQQQTLLQLSTALVPLMDQQCVHSIEPPVTTWSHYRQKGICSALSSEETRSLTGLILIHGKRQCWNRSKRKDGWVTVYLFNPPICRLKASKSELHPPLENKYGHAAFLRRTVAC